TVAHTIQVTQSATNNQIGDSLTISAGSVAAGSTGAAGGALVLSGGYAGGSGNNAGGAVNINGGNKTGTGAVGAVVIQGTNAGNVGINTSTFSNLIASTTSNLVINSGLSGAAGLQFTQFNNTSTVITNPTSKILSVDANGNIILVTDQTGSAGSGASTVGAVDTFTGTSVGATISSGTLY